jgi:streptogramin lyase
MGGTTAGTLGAAPQLRSRKTPPPIAAAATTQATRTRRPDVRVRPGSASAARASSPDVGQDACGAISAGAGQIWVGRCDTGRGWVRVDAKRSRVAGVIHGFGLQVAFGGGSAWVPGLTGTKELLRVNPATGATISTIELPSDPAFVLYARGTVWTLSPDDGALVTIDAARGKIVETSSVRRSVAWAYLTMANGVLWLGADAPAVLRYDPATKKLTKLAIRATPGLGDRPLATGAGSLWWRTAPSVVSRIDPASGKVDGKYPADELPGGGQHAVGFGSLWVANFEADTVWRVRIDK